MNDLDPDIISYLVGLKQRGVHLGLERMRAFVAALANPQDHVPCVHVAGTNGKGSVAAMLEAVFRSAGWRTGLYTSPHLIRLAERIQVDREPIRTSDLAACVREFQPVVEQRIRADGPEARPTYFEFMTAMAFVHFARSGCDIAIIEAGLGGRLDATNVVNPEVSVITSIGLDHTDFLGETIEAIAAEKAGIIKRGRPVVIGRLPGPAERVIRRAAEAQGSRVISVAEKFGTDPAAYPRTNVAGEHQRINAATATLVAGQFDPSWHLSGPRLHDALLGIDWPARWQRFELAGRTVVIDASHNSEGAGALAANLAALVRETGARPVVVFGALGRARARPLLEALCAQAAEVRLVEPQQRRACSFAELEALVPAGYGGRVLRSSIAEVFPRAGECLPGVVASVPVVVTGSIYLAGEALTAIDPGRGPIEHALQDF